jgi:hypothetical protein
VCGEEGCGLSACFGAGTGRANEQFEPVSQVTMKKIVLRALVVLVAITFVLWIFFSPQTYRFRLTIAADVNDEVRSASSVIEIRSSTYFVPGTSLSTSWDVVGEAVFLDLGDGRNVIATLAFGPTASVRRMNYLVPTTFGVRPQDVFNRLETGNEQALSGENIPTLVTFSDLTDPSTARVVVPEEFATVFGSDVRFLGARIQMTRDPVTETIESQLPWLSEMRERLRGHGEYRYSNQLNVVPSLFVRRS